MSDAGSGPAALPDAEEVPDFGALTRLAGRRYLVLAGYGPLLEITDEVWNWEHDIVLRHAWLATQTFAPVVAERGGGSLVFVASVSGLRSAPGHGAYGAPSRRP